MEIDWEAGLSSVPCPLCARFRPGRWNERTDEDGRPLWIGELSWESPNRKKKLRFLEVGLLSSFRPTSSKASSSSIDGSGPRLLVLVMVVRGDSRANAKRESNEAREGVVLILLTGDLADISYLILAVFN